MTDKPHPIESAESRRREGIDATVRNVIEEFNGRFEMLSDHGYTLATTTDIFYDVRDTLGGAEFRLVATTLFAQGLDTVGADVRRQLTARVRQIA